MNTLVVLEIFHLFFIRNIHGTSLTWEAAKGTKVVWACVDRGRQSRSSPSPTCPPLQTVFGTRSVSLRDGLLIVAIGGVFFALIETEKQMRLAFRQTSQGRAHLKTGQAGSLCSRRQRLLGASQLTGLPSCLLPLLSATAELASISLSPSWSEEQA